jgi:hypothetical protein
MLSILVDREAEYGLSIKDALEIFRDEEINHERLS